ncbi:MAG: serpin family protein [Bacteroidales bacterium]|nr:serpin family protein [Bacteroidales bacterium]
MKAFQTLLFVTFLMLMSGCAKDKPKPQPDPATTIHLTEKGAAVIGKSNDFGIQLFQKVAVAEPDNLMLSPLSASVALTMLMNGAEEETYNQINTMLGYDGMTAAEVNEAYRSLVTQLLAADASVQLSLANAVWYRNSFVAKAAFLQTMQEDFDAQVQGLDFGSPAALTTINGWASDNTNGKIDKVLNEISSDAVMFLMNALYFKGSWSQKFDKNQTNEAAFHYHDGSTGYIPTMHGQVPARLVASPAYQAIEIYYGRKNFSMIILLPDADIDALTESLTPALWNDLTQQLDAGYERDVDLSMPQFSFDYEKNLNDALMALGMMDAFFPGIANLTGIADAALHVSFVKQNTFVDVNEDGTEAAAVTTIGIELTSAGDLPPQFIVDRPFLFFIREQTTNTLMFAGKVMAP